MEKTSHNFETLAIRTQADQSQFREHTTALYLTSSFTFNSAEQGAAIFQGQEDGNLYSRFSNPNTSEFINKLCALEDCEEGIATASGMAAIYTSFVTFLSQGDHILASKDIFGNATYIIEKLLPRMGVSYTFVDVDDLQAWEEEIKPNTRLIYVESPSNPTLKIADLASIAGLCKVNKIISVIDNCFATPYLQQPAHFGFDLVLHSATKYLDGQGRVIGGAIVGKGDLIKQCYDFIRRTGACLSPFNAWVLAKSIETLSLRMERHCSNALQLAEWLSQQSEVGSVSYPFLDAHPQVELARKQMKLGGGLVAIDLAGDAESGHKFLNSLQLFSLTANLGDSRSIATHPASTTHSKLDTASQLAMGITPGYIRLSVGLEHIDDLKNDVEQALKKIK